MEDNKINGILGITDDGQPIVTANYQCPHFTRQPERLLCVQECWYCQYSDFRKTCDIMLQQSICRCPKNRVNVIESSKNEEVSPSPQIEKFVSNIKGGVITCIFNPDTLSSKAVYINQGWTAITGYTLDELNSQKGGNPQALVHPDDKPTADYEYGRQMQLGNEYALLYRVINKDGRVIWVMDRGIVTILPSGSVQNQSIVTEVTELKEQEERLRILAQTDQLTDINNKATFALLAQTVLNRKSEHKHAMMMLDIDNFKGINDTYGHAYGDKVLEAVGARLKELFRSRDVLGRIGGDEFMILMTDVPDASVVSQKAEELCLAVSNIKLLEKSVPDITISIGIAFFEHGKTYESLFEEADHALYRAKNNGKNQFAI